MKFSLTLLFIFQLFILFATPKDTIGIIKKQEVYSLDGRCNDSILWEEVRMKNVTLQNNINADIIALIQSFKVNPDDYEGV